MPVFFNDIPAAFVIRHQKWLLLPQYDALCSGELSAYTHGIRELLPEPFITLSKNESDRLKVADGAVMSIDIHQHKYSLPVKIDDKLSNGVVLMSAGLQGMPAMYWNTWVEISL